ncbi:MAG: methyltransferase domain-containing protein [Gammaproteobacteria bacterium]|nr:MAG: methyltransferase domain-containing protein [Gammaproteobacteria bacterium]
MTSNSDIARAYDEAFYESTAFLQTHPETLAGIALLFGIQPSNPAHCRVLEIGSALGDNLIPMALNAPDSQFVGVDISTRQVDEAATRAAQLGLKNIRFYSGSIEHLPDSAGPFDYIVCHGVFSWVPQEVQQAILSRCKALLAPQGILYVSYNTYPGWHFRDYIKHAIQFNGKKASSTDEKYEALKDIVTLLSRHAVQTPAFPARGIFETFSKQLESLPKSYLVHEYYEPFNIPLYVSEFMQLIEKHELQYVGEAMLSDNFLLSDQAELRQSLLDKSTSRGEYEQYLDLIISRGFRSSLVTHKGLAVNANIHPDRIRPFYFMSDLKPLDNRVPEDNTRPVRFKSADKSREVKATSPLTKAALYCLSQAWPLGFNFNDLVHQAYRILRRDITQADIEDVKQQATSLCQDMLDIYAKGQLPCLRVTPPLCTNQISNQPLLSPLARTQIQRGGQQLTSQLHATVKMDALSQQIALLCTGTNTQDEIVNATEQLIKNEGKALGLNADSCRKPRQSAEKAVDMVLEMLRAQALLVG